jgi:phosphate/phosphite/phosphonate ABC transporter binding protein
MQSERTCKECGKPIPPDARQDSCPHCLMKLALEPDVEETETGPGEPSKHLWAGDYERVKEVACSEMAMVYKAHQISLDRVVALKVMMNQRLDDPFMAQRFQVEARAIARLEHPNIVPIHQVGEHLGLHFFAMRFIEGGSLQERIRAGEFRAPDTAQGGSRRSIREWNRTIARLVLDIARAVRFAHQHGVLHLDLKPANVLMDLENQPHVTDFGLAQCLARDETGIDRSAIAGTPGYMAPEQISDSDCRLTTATDAYGLGAILYELLTGQPPFHAESPQETMTLVLSSEPKAPRAINPAVDERLEAICLKCLQKAPQQRYASARDLAEDLQRWIEHRPIQARPARWPQPLVLWARRNPTLAVAEVVVLALLITVIALLARVAQEETKARDVFRKDVNAGLDDLWMNTEEVEYRVPSEKRRALAGRSPLSEAKNVPLQPRLVFAVYTHRTPTNMLYGFSPVLDHIEEYLGAPVDFVIYKGYSNAINALVEGKVQFMKIGPASYVEAQELTKNQENPILLAQQVHAGQSNMYGVIFVRSDSPIGSLKDLRNQQGLANKLFAFGDPSSTFGSYMARAALVGAGIYATNFAAHKHLASHDATVKEVLGNTNVVAGAANESAVKDAILAGAKLKVISTMECVTFPWVGATNLAPTDAHLIQRCLLSLKDRKMLVGIDKDLTGFQKAKPADYDSLKPLMTNAVKFEMAK